MALTKCHECGQDVSTQAKACPTCGAKVKKPSGIRLLLFVLAVPGVLGLIALATKNQQIQPPSSTPAPLTPEQIRGQSTAASDIPAVSKPISPLAGETGQGTPPPQRTLIRSVPAGHVDSYKNAAGETVEETENPLGKLIVRQFYRPVPPACAYLHSLDLKTDRYWRQDPDPVFHCLSPYKELGTAADPLGLSSKNNLAYYVDGDAERIHQMTLVLNVYHHNVKPRHEAKEAHQPLGQAAKRLTQKALKTPLPKAAAQAIAAGKPWQGAAKAAMLELTRDEWPSGKGYTLYFLVRPAGQTP